MTGLSDSTPPPFHAVLYPNPPLGAAGVAALLGACAIFSAAVGYAFARVGAWPVTGFVGLDLLLLWWAFAVVRRRARRREEIRLDPTGLHVRRIEPDGSERSERLEPYWVRVQLDQPSPTVARLWLRSHGRRLRIGAFLSAEEARGLAQALDRALGAYR